MKKILITIASLLISTSLYAKSIQDYEQEAENNNPNSAFKAGLAYEFGVQGSLDKNLNKAIRYYEISSNNGNAKASSRLGVIYYNRAYYPKAIEYFKLGAQKGEGLSLAYLGKVMEKNNKNDSALKFYRESVKTNNPYGKMFLGEYLIKNNPKSSDSFLEGYAVLISANKQNPEAKTIMDRYPYQFNKKDQARLLQLVKQYK